ncbi:MAG: bifunctional hydroxymethylpyrimidine kinase/phosphomethylpyrimidine kinase [Muribaculaceae bacterium]
MDVKTNTYPRCLTIAGSDCSGGAGIQADLKTFAALGVYGMSAITALTAQNTLGVTHVQPTPPSHLALEIDAIFSDIRPDAIKIGMSVNEHIIVTIANKLAQHHATNVILDPVMISTSGHQLIQDQAIDALIEQLMPLCMLLTPNKHEAERIANMPINNVDDVCTAAQRMLQHVPAVLIKGGHMDDNAMTDYLFMRNEPEPQLFKSHRITTNNTHGTGCTLSSAIAAHLALGCTLTQAVGKAKEYLTAALEHGSNIAIGHGHGPVNHGWNPMKLKIK